MGALQNISLATALVVTLTACASEPEAATPQQKAPAQAESAGTKPWLDDTKPAAPDGKVGGAGTPCELPISFDVAAKWKAKQIEEAADGGALTNQGGFTMACEIDAKPAGHLGFLRVWTSTRTGPARAALDQFLAADRNITAPEIREVQVAGTAAAEVTYVRDNPSADVKKRERLVVVPTPKGTALVHLGGFDDGEHDGMLPAYILAKQTMKI